MVANDMYSLLNRDNLTQAVQMILSKKLKTFSESFSSLFKCRSKIEHFEKKWWPSLLMYFRNKRLCNRWLDECLKSLVSEEPLTSNMVNGCKHWWNLHGSTLPISIDHCEENSVKKSLSS